MMKQILRIPAAVFLLFLAACEFGSEETSAALSGPEADLIDAVRNPRRQDLPQALTRVHSLNYRDASGLTPLEHAVIGGDEKKIRQVLSAGADPVFPDAKGYTSLHIAAGISDPLPLRLLLDAGAPCDVPGPGGKTPLMEALRLGNVPAVKLLLERGADTRRFDEQERRPLCFAAAARTHSFNLVKLLLEHGAERAIYDKMGRTPLFHAIDAGNTDTALYLLSLLPDFDQDGPADMMGFLAMKHAVLACNLRIVQAIVSKRLPLNQDISVLYKTLEALNIEGFHELMARNDVIGDGRTPLFWAAATEYEDIIQFLLDSGADPFARDSMGRMPIAYTRYRETTNLLKRAMSEREKEK